MEHDHALQDFIAWRDSHIQGDETGEAQLFLDRLFRAFANCLGTTN
jgi:hypothetical protein